MRRLGRIWMVVVVVGVVCGSAQGKYGGGTGEPNDPYQIWDANHMQAIGADANDWDKCFVLMAEIDLGQFDGKDGREEFNVIGRHPTPFTGVFDGNDHAILNFTYDSNTEDNVGVFGQVLYNGLLTSGVAGIRRLGLIGPKVHGSNFVGSLVGLLADGAIVNDCYMEGGSIEGYSSVGGLVGANGWEGQWITTAPGRIANCCANGTVVGDSSIGGLVGSNIGSIFGCHSWGDVNGSYCVGGLVGLNMCDYSGGPISGCYSNGDVSGDTCVGGLMGLGCSLPVSGCYATGDVNGGYYVGGLIGDFVGDILDCYSTGSVNGDGRVGGLIGMRKGHASHCYSVGDVNGIEEVGGLVGLNDNIYGSISDCYWDIETSGEPNMCGWGDCDPNYGKTTVQMKQQSTFTDWDFINVWDIGENQTYPYLRTVPAGDINKDRIVNFLDLCIVAEEWMKEN